MWCSHPRHPQHLAGARSLDPHHLRRGPLLRLHRRHPVAVHQHGLPGITARFPKLKLAFLEIGATWLPYYLDRLDEHWEKRGAHEMPLLKQKPSDVLRESNMYFSLESGESSWPPPWTTSAATTSSTPPTSRTGTTSSPENLHHLRNHPDLSDEVKEKILRTNAKRLFDLN